eukprot:1100227-Prymnesium_polylepis.1
MIRFEGRIGRCTMGPGQADEREVVAVEPLNQPSRGGLEHRPTARVITHAMHVPPLLLEGPSEEGDEAVPRPCRHASHARSDGKFHQVRRRRRSVAPNAGRPPQGAAARPQLASRRPRSASERRQDSEFRRSNRQL